MENQDKKRNLGKRHIIIFLLGVFLLSGTVSYAYFTAQTKSEGAGEVTTETTIVKDDNKLVTEGELTFDDKDIYPGHKSISSIKATAYGDIEIDYNLIWTGTSSFTTPLKYYVYKTTTKETPSITCDKKTGLVDNVTTYYEECTNNGFDNLGEIVAKGEIPTLAESTKMELIKNENIQATSEGNTVYYYVVIEFPNKEGGQNADFNASINGEVSTEIATTVSDAILAGKTIVEMPSITGISSDTSNTLYTVEDDDGTSYVFRGNPSNNWVQFGGFYWRIIRINGDGSMRLIYNGTSTAITGTGTQIGTYTYNSSRNDNAYVGFMYGDTGASTYEATHANTNDSNVKSQLESWYTSSGINNYAEYLDINAGFCNDRSLNTGNETWWNMDTKRGYGTNATVYGPYGRVILNGSWRTTPVPSLECPNANNDLFTVSGSSKGNNKLSNPVGLITSDEVVFAGGFGVTANSEYYLYTNQNYWAMSPCSMDTSGSANVFYVATNGDLIGNNVNNPIGVRPVINIRADVTLTGNGTINSPYLIS